MRRAWWLVPWATMARVRMAFRREVDLQFSLIFWLMLFGVSAYCCGRGLPSNSFVCCVVFGVVWYLLLLYWHVGMVSGSENIGLLAGWCCLFCLLLMKIPYISYTYLSWYYKAFVKFWIFPSWYQIAHLFNSLQSCQQWGSSLDLASNLTIAIGCVINWYILCHILNTYIWYTLSWSHIPDILDTHLLDFL